MAKWYLLTLFLLFILTSCTAQPTAPASSPPDTTETPLSPVTGGEGSLLEAFRSAGATVEQAGAVEQPFFNVPGQKILVNGKEVQVFEYASEEARAAQSSQISPDGSSIGTNMVGWVDKPNFWAKGNAIALYIGQDQETINLISQVLGNPITAP